MEDREYGVEDIRVISELADVRQRPGMFLGDPTSAQAAEHALDELLSNAVDQFLAGKVTRIHVVLDAPYVEVQDDGPGLPFEREHEGVRLAQALFENMHGTPTAFGHAPHVHLHKLHGVGLAVVSAFSAELSCTSWVGGRHWVQTFAEGRLVEAPHVVEEGQGRGTLVRFRLDPTLFEVVMPRHGIVRGRLFEMVHLFPGLRASLGEEVFTAPRGLADLAETLDAPTALGQHEWSGRPTFHLHHEDDAIQVQAAALGHAEETTWRTWVNGGPTPLHGVHQHVFERALRALSWTPSMAMLHLVAKDPRYAGPTKDRLASADAEGLEEVLAAALRAFALEHDVGEP